MRHIFFLFASGAILLGCFISNSAAEEYRTGALRVTEMPAWVIPSQFIEYLGPRGELDEECDNSAGLPPVGNQSSQGSCTAWATAYYYLTYTQGQEYGWDLTNPEYQCSPAFTYNMINGGFDGGSYPPDAFILFESMGCAPMSDMSYNANNCTRFPSETAFRNGLQFRTNSTYFIDVYSYGGIQSLKNHLLNGNIAATAITVWSNFMNISRFDYNYCVNDIYGTNPGGHAVTIVGFDDNRETSDGTGAFRMVNSWGTSWGDDGFWWMSYEAMRHQSISWGSAYYASDRINYEATLVARIEISHSDRYSLLYSMGLGRPESPRVVFEFNNFYIGARADIPYPESAFILDLTDFSNLINEDEANDIFLKAVDRNRNDGHSGTIRSLVVEDIQRPHFAHSQDTPAIIQDSNDGGQATVVFYYSVVPPDNLEADLDLSNGHVLLTWNTPDELDDFIEYAVLRNGEEIGATSGTEYLDELAEFGIYTYSVVSRWDECPSWPTDEVEMNWIEPVVPRYTSIWSVEAETGNFILSWEQLRDLEIAYDDGTAESTIFPNESAERGTMIAVRFSAPDAGKVLRVGADFLANNNGNMGRVRLVLLYDGDGDVPGEEFYHSPLFLPQSQGWHWIDLEGARMPMDNAGYFWAALCWEDLNMTRLGRDINGEQYQHKAMTPDGINWEPFACVGNPMLRVTYGTEERVDDWTGLQGFDIYMDGEWLGHSESDEHRIEGTFTGPGSYEFQVNALYQQGIWEGVLQTFDWNGEDLKVSEEELPLTWRVGNPYPNPFNSTTVLEVELPQSSPLQVEVFNLLGQRVAVIAEGRFQPGIHKLTFDASNLASGVYLLRTDVPNHLHQVQKVVLIR